MCKVEKLREHLSIFLTVFGGEWSWALSVSSPPDSALSSGPRGTGGSKEPGLGTPLPWPHGALFVGRLCVSASSLLPKASPQESPLPPQMPRSPSSCARCLPHVISHHPPGAHCQALFRALTYMTPTAL